MIMTIAAGIWVALLIPAMIGAALWLVMILLQLAAKIWPITLLLVAMAVVKLGGWG